MIKFISLFVLLTRTSFSVYCQETSAEDTLQGENLQEVVLRAYEQNRKLVDVPGAVNYLNRRMLNRFNNASVLNALNATAGVRMEERSPGSYRLNIRGSSLRSPFGVRNVKIYYNNIPFTDPGGNTYLNQLGFYNFGTIEILKGPGSSLYGAGTGGVMLIESNPVSDKKAVTLSYTGGSYGLSNSNVNIRTGNDTFSNVINYQHQSGNGFRDQSKMRRDIFSWEAVARLNETDKITGTFFYGDLYYQTPGALTLAEYELNARVARPAVGVNPGAKEANAAIFQKMFLAGLSYEKGLNSNWKHTSTLYGAFTKLDNPAIRNYARNNQPHVGGRTIFQYKKIQQISELTWHTGAEVQQGFATAKIYKNRSGLPDSLQTDDEININTYFIFTQLHYAFKSWMMTGGVSYNRSKINFTRLSNSPSTGYALRFKNQFAPRLAILKKLQKSLSLYASWSKGFSPPTSEEVFPTGSLSNPDLSAEQGINYEVGFKGLALKSRLSFDINAFYFSVQNSIVQRRDAAGGDYYTNAGSTRQKGIESQATYQLLPANNLRHSATIWLSHTFYDFHYKDFKQLENNYSGKRLPGAAKHNFTTGLDWQSAIGFYSNITYQYNDPVPLNDANTAYTEAFHLLGNRLGFRHTYTRLSLDVFAGADNVFDVRYSLGNDINAFGGRYYNAAPGRNYFAGITVSGIY